MQGLQQPIRTGRVACQVEGEAAAPASAVPQGGFNLFWEMTEDQVETGHALAGEKLDDVLDERTVQEGEQRSRGSFIQGGQARHISRRDNYCPHRRTSPGSLR